jgi:hypothetical protein
MLNSNLIKDVNFFYFSIFSRSTYSRLAKHSLGNAALEYGIRNIPVDTRYTSEQTGCRASCRYKHPGKQFQTWLYQRVIWRAGNNWRGCWVEDQRKGNKSNDSDKKWRTCDWYSQSREFPSWRSVTIYTSGPSYDE